MEPMYVSSAPSPAIRRSSVNACERKSGEGQQIGTNTVLGGHFSFIISAEMCPLPGICAQINKNIQCCSVVIKKKQLQYLQKPGHGSNLDVYLQIKKLWYIYTMEYYSAIKRNEFESIVVRCVNLEPLIQSEVSQKEKNKYHILTYILIYGIQKNVSDELSREWTYGQSRGR